MVGGVAANVKMMSALVNRYPNFGICLGVVWDLELVLDILASRE